MYVLVQSQMNEKFIEIFRMSNKNLLLTQKYVDQLHNIFIRALTHSLITCCLYFKQRTKNISKNNLYSIFTDQSIL